MSKRKQSFSSVVWYLCKESLYSAIFITALLGVGWGILIIAIPTLLESSINFERMILMYGGFIFLGVFLLSFLFISIRYLSKGEVRIKPTVAEKVNDKLDRYKKKTNRELKKINVKIDKLIK
jgi:hypothetical protein